MLNVAPAQNNSLEDHIPKWWACVCEINFSYTDLWFSAISWKWQSTWCCTRESTHVAARVSERYASTICYNLASNWKLRCLKALFVGWLQTQITGTHTQYCSSNHYFFSVGGAEETSHLLISILLLCPNVCLPLNPPWQYSEFSCEECVWPFKCKATKLQSLQLILSSDHSQPGQITIATSQPTSNCG